MDMLNPEIRDEVFSLNRPVRRVSMPMPARIIQNRLQWKLSDCRWLYIDGSLKIVSFSEGQHFKRVELKNCVIMQNTLLEDAILQT
jgi:hypothetical protein